MVITDDPAYLQAGGYFRAPGLTSIDAGPTPDPDAGHATPRADGGDPGPDADETDAGARPSDAEADDDATEVLDAQTPSEDAQASVDSGHESGGAPPADSGPDSGGPAIAARTQCGCSSSGSEDWRWAAAGIAVLALLRRRGLA